MIFHLAAKAEAVKAALGRRPSSGLHPIYFNACAASASYEYNLRCSAHCLLNVNQRIRQSKNQTNQRNTCTTPLALLILLLVASCSVYPHAPSPAPPVPEAPVALQPAQVI
eukprot:961253-Pleurochrysis_carterae.AAC.1